MNEPHDKDRTRSYRRARCTGHRKTSPHESHFETADGRNVSKRQQRQREREREEKQRGGGKKKEVKMSYLPVFQTGFTHTKIKHPGIWSHLPVQRIVPAQNDKRITDQHRGLLDAITKRE